MQREPLVAATDLDPMRLVGGLADKHGDAGRASDLARVLVVLVLLRVRPPERQRAQPGRDRGIAGSHAVQAVSGAYRIVAVEADPCLELLDERRVRHLGDVALDDEIEHAAHLSGVRQQQQLHVAGGSCAGEQAELLVGQRLAVVVASRALASRNRIEQGRDHRRDRRERHLDRVPVGVEAGHGLEPVGRRGLDQVLGSTAQRHEDMVVIGVDSGAGPREVGQDRDRPVGDREFPALRVVAGRRERRTSNELVSKCGGGDSRQRTSAPGSRRRGLVTLRVRRRRARRQDRCATEHGRRRGKKPPSRHVGHHGN